MLSATAAQRLEANGLHDQIIAHPVQAGAC
jgi:hypothetical protein